jgi:hypothetical protein
MFSSLLSSRLRALWRLALFVLLIAPLGACRDATLLTAPEDPERPSVPPCASVDCSTFRNLTSSALEAPAAAASATAASSLGNRELGVRLRDRIQQIRNDIAANRRDPARLQLLAVLADIDRALADSSRRADWPDLSMIRLNLEPFIINLGLR